MKSLFPSMMVAIGMAIGGYVSPSVCYGSDYENMPDFYIRGELNGWSIDPSLKMKRENNVYSIFLEKLNGEFKIGDPEWIHNFGSNTGMKEHISSSCTVKGMVRGENFIADNLENVNISFVYDNSFDTRITFTVNFEAPDDPDDPDIPDVDERLSGTLPVLYINVYDMNGGYDNEIISKDLSHKNYFSGEYWLDINGCEWLEEEGGVSIGSEEAPLPLEIKARGNWTRKGFSKKPFKLKLGKKQSLLGMTKSKHYAILAHADDIFGYMRNFTGFNLGKRIELPWTPWQQPIEVVINGDYRGVYFLTESIRVGDDRIMIQELEDNATDPELVSGGYLVELDNYDEENQIRMQEKGQGWYMYRDMLRITFDTPEVYSDIQQKFVTDQFTAMNDAIGDNSDRLWSYMDLDDAARYYIVEEILSHTESYHGSTYLFRDRGEGQKWHFSPLWDCGNAFMGRTDSYFTYDAPFGNTWVSSLRMNDMFMEKVRETWKWFMSQKFDGLYDELDLYSERLEAAAAADYRRWNNQPRPNFEGSQGVVDNRDMSQRLSDVKRHLKDKINWLKEQWGDYSNGYFEEPERDNTEAAPLPEYITTAINPVIPNQSEEVTPEIYDLTGMKVDNPKNGNICIVRKNGETRKVLIR